MEPRVYKKNKRINLMMILSGILLTYTNLNTLIKYGSNEVWFFVAIIAIIFSLSTIVMSSIGYYRNYKGYKNAVWNRMSESERQRIKRNKKLEDLGIE